MADTKRYTIEVNQRFLEAMEAILAQKVNGIETALAFGKEIGITSSNLNRLRHSAGGNTVSLEAIGRLIRTFKVSALWLMTGKGDMFNNDITVLHQSDLDRKLKALKSMISDLNKTVDAMQSRRGKKGG